MQVPKSFQKLAATRGTGVDGAIPKDTKVIFAIGGYSYRLELWHGVNQTLDQGILKGEVSLYC